MIDGWEFMLATTLPDGTPESAQTLLMARAVTSRSGTWTEVNPDGSIEILGGSPELPNFDPDSN